MDRMFNPGDHSMNRQSISELDMSIEHTRTVVKIRLQWFANYNYLYRTESKAMSSQSPMSTPRLQLRVLPRRDISENRPMEIVAWFEWCMEELEKMH